MKSAYKRMRDQNNAVQRNTYQKRKDEGLCTKCGKRWAEAGKAKCRPCREYYQKWYRDHNMREWLWDYNKQKRAGRKEKGLCVNCGARLTDEERGVNIQCLRCRKKDRERLNMKRLRDRIHGIPRSDRKRADA